MVSANSTNLQSVRYPFWPVWKHRKDIEMGRKRKGRLSNFESNKPRQFQSKKEQSTNSMDSDTVCLCPSYMVTSGVLLSLLHTSPIWVSIQAH